MERRWRRNALAVGLLVVVSPMNWVSVPSVVPRRSAAATAALAAHILGSSRSARADGPIEDFQKRLDKFSDELDAMADQYNPITYTSPSGVVFEFPNPIDYMIGSGQGAKSDLWKDRENSIYNKAIRADPAGAFKKQVDKATDVWKQMSASIEPKLESEKPKIQDVRSAVLLRKTPLLETMTSAADILKGDGQEAFDRESLVQQQDALDKALSRVVGYAEARQVAGVRQSYYEAKDIFTSWTVSRVGR